MGLNLVVGFACGGKRKTLDLVVGDRAWVLVLVLADLAEERTGRDTDLCAVGWCLCLGEFFCMASREDLSPSGISIVSFFVLTISFFFPDFGDKSPFLLDFFRFIV